jgi:hypothetical protein
MLQKDPVTLRLILTQRNVSLGHDLRALAASLQAATIPARLEPYRSRLTTICRDYADLSDRHLLLLSLAQDRILDDVLSGTQQATQVVRLLTGRFAASVLRSDARDALCLKVIEWMHGVHPKTAPLPAAFESGDVAVRPFLRIAPIYSFPCLEQHGILFQPLHLHEFGHVLYVLHKPEMDDLVKEIQQVVEDVLQPLSQRNDRHAETQAARQQAVVNTWYAWAQEFFCDAVGLTMGGPAYLCAFSGYCGNLSRTDFYRADKDLRNSAHPVTWLRIHFLARRASELGFAGLAREVEEEWVVLANTMGVTEDYHGYYDEAIEDDLHRILGDMLLEVDTRQFLPDESVPSRDIQATDTPIHLMNRAWQLHQRDPVQYPAWEARALLDYLQEDVADQEDGLPG